MANFKSLSDRPSLERAIQLSDEEVDADAQSQRPGRARLSSLGASGMVMDQAKQDAFNKRVELTKRLKRKELAQKYGRTDV